MKKYHKHLARVVTLGLLLSSGGVMSCVQAQDYGTADAPKEHASAASLKGEYDNVYIVNNSYGDSSNMTTSTAINDDLHIKNLHTEVNSVAGSAGITALQNNGASKSGNYKVGTASLTVDRAVIAVHGQDDVIGVSSTDGQHATKIADLQIAVSTVTDTANSNAPTTVAGIDVEGYYKRASSSNISRYNNTLTADNVRIDLGLASGSGGTVNMTGVLTKGDWLKQEDKTQGYGGRTDIKNVQIIISQRGDGQSNETVRGVWATKSDIGTAYTENTDLASIQNYDDLAIVTGSSEADTAAYTAGRVQGGSELIGVQADNGAQVKVGEKLLIDIDRGARKAGEDANGVSGIYAHSYGKVDFNAGLINLHNDQEGQVVGIEATAHAEVTGKTLMLRAESDSGSAMGLLVHKYEDDADGNAKITLGEAGGEASQVTAVSGGALASAVTANHAGIITFNSAAELTAQSTNYAETVAAINGGQVIFADNAKVTAAGIGEAAGYLYGVSAYFDDDSAAAESKIIFQKGAYIDAAGGTAVSAAGNDDTSAKGSISINQGSAAGLNDVVILGDIEAGNNGVVDVTLNTAASVFSGSSNLSGNGAVNLAVTDGAGWRVTGNSAVTALHAADGGKIDMTADADAFSTLTVGKLTGSGAGFFVDNDGTSSDKIDIADSEAGTHSITINNISSLVGKTLAAENTVISAKGAAAFVGATTYGGGIYEYTPNLDKTTDAEGFNNWYVQSLNSKVVGDALAVAATSTPVYYAWLHGSDNLRSRLGELRQNSERGAWARVFGGKLRGSGYDNKYHTYQVGYDQALGNWQLGAAYEYTKGDVSGTTSGDSKVGAVSLYGTMQQADGSAFDIVLKHGRIYGDVKTWGQYPDSGAYETNATSLSVEYNKRFEQQHGIFVEPQAQLVYGHINGNSYTTAKGIDVTTDGIDTLVGRLGISAGQQLRHGSVYARLSLLHEFCGDGTARLTDKNGAALTRGFDYGDTWFELALGGNVALGKNCELYGDVERGFGADVNKKWGANLGVRYSF